ncbi:MAG: NAD(P)H-hydrate epimerase [Tissierellia bacterium]|nr:NAD(P)H-hydrate epimerase [Tissierellia bacterium]
MITCDKMKKADAYAINSIKVPSIVLMENAAIGFVNALNFENYNNIGIICGVGNNGGDGLAIARQLVIKNKNVSVYIVGNIEKSTIDFNINLEILKNLSIPIKFISNKSELSDSLDSLKKCDLYIDGIFGIGLTREVDGIFYDTIEFMNSQNTPIYSIDIPSGLNGDTGNPMGISVKANHTVTFHKMKVGLADASDYTGKISIAHIGVPENIY